MWIEPAPPTAADVFQITLKVTRPDGIVDVFDVKPIRGSYVWLYAPNQVGNFTFQVVFEGQSFANGVVYTPSSSSAVLVVPGTPRPSVEGDGGTWATKASMSKARGGLGVVALDGKIYAIGGEEKALQHASGDIYLLTTNEEYNPATDTWTLKSSMPTARTNFAIAAVQGKIYCMGGIIGIEAYSNFPQSSGSQTETERSYTLTNFVHYRAILTNANEVYDPATDTWETKAPLPSNMSGATANVVNERIYLPIGSNHYVYDPIQDSWTTTESTSNVEGSSVSAVIGNKIYYIDRSRRVSIYEPQTNTWRQGAYTPEIEIAGPVGATTGVSARGRIYVFVIEPFTANQQENGSADERRATYIYDPETDTWVTGARIPTNRYTFGVANIGDALYLVGGHGRTSRADFAVNEQYMPIGYRYPIDWGSVNIISPDEPVTLFVFAIAGAAVAVTSVFLVYLKKRAHKTKTGTFES